MTKIDEVVEREFAPSNGSFCFGFTKEELRALLQEATEEYRKDAERYRWLRDVGGSTWTPFVIHGLQTAKSVDEWIDAAIAAAKEE